MLEFGEDGGAPEVIAVPVFTVKVLARWVRQRHRGFTGGIGVAIGRERALGATDVGVLVARTNCPDGVWRQVDIDNAVDLVRLPLAATVVVITFVVLTEHQAPAHITALGQWPGDVNHASIVVPGAGTDFC
ncbi:hypothetical protein D3C73_743150 [compost metagenome]